MGLIRKSKVTMHSSIVCKIIDTALPKYEPLGIKPWHHMTLCGEHLYIYVWDSRKIEAILDARQVDKNDVTYQVKDNRMDLLCIREEVSDEIWNLANEDAELMPILLAEGTLTEHERELLTIEHI